MTGYPGNYGQQSQQSSFNAIASIGPPQQASNPDKFAPTNIFAAMKKQDFGKPEEQRPQDSSTSTLPTFHEANLTCGFFYRQV
jgi:hypothetical protein